MNIQPISITEFRNNTKRLLDECKNGPIWVSRNWELFKIERVAGSPSFTLPPDVETKVDTMRETSEPVRVTPENWGA